MILLEYTQEEKEKEANLKFSLDVFDYSKKYKEFIREIENRQKVYFSKNIPELIEKIKASALVVIKVLKYATENLKHDKELSKKIFAITGKNFNGISILGYQFTFSNDNNILREELLRAYACQIELIQEKAPEHYEEIIKFINQTLEASSPVKTRTFRAQELKLDRSKANKGIREGHNALYTEDGLTVETIHIGKKKKPIYTPVLLNYITEELEKQGLSATVIGHLDAFDMEVLMHVESLYEAGNKKITVDMITTQMAGGKRTQATPKMKEAIYKSLLRLRLTNITIHTENEYKAGYNKQTLFSGVILPNKIEGEPIELNGKRIEEYIHILDISPLSKYADSKNQISRPPVNMLDVPVSLTRENILLKHYLARRIIDMQSPDEWRGKYIIIYETIFEYLKIEANSPQMLRNKKNKIREAVRAILKEWIKKGIIIDFEELGKDNKPQKSRSPIVKIKITMPTFTPEIKEC